MVDQQCAPRHLSLFAGIGGTILAGEMLGWRTIGAVEIEPYAQAVLMHRQNQGEFSPFPVWDDIRTFNGTPWRGHVDIVSGGFPCQDISAAGKGAGIEGERSSLWFEMARVVSEIRPDVVFVENSGFLRTRGLDRVLAGLSELGYDARWGIVSAASVGAPHQRDRLWLVAYTNREQLRLISRWREWQGRSKEPPKPRDNGEERNSVADPNIKWELQPKRFEFNERRRASDISEKEMADATNRKGAIRSEAKQTWPFSCDQDLSHAKGEKQVWGGVGMDGGRGSREKLERSGNKELINGGNLNPLFVEWMMGFPIGFTDLEV